MDEIEQESPEEKAFFESGGEAAPEPEQLEIETPETPAAPEPEKQEAAPEADKPEEQKAEEETKVPYSALHEERMLRKEANEELKQVREQIESLQSLREELTEFRNAKKTEEDKVSYEEDPIGHLREQQEKLQAQMEKQTTETQEKNAQLQEVQELQNTINAQVNEFVKTQPDYQDALNFVSERRMQDLAALGITDPVQQQQIINTEAWNIAQTALNNNKNPAEVVYTMANSWGYKATGTVEKTELEEKVETIEKGQQMSQTLSDAGGAPDSTGISLADIESMSDDDFDKLWDKLESGG